MPANVTSLAIQEQVVTLAKCRYSGVNHTHLSELLTEREGPSAADLADEVAGPYIKKYLAASPDGDVMDRIKVLRLIENLVAGAGSVGYLIESMHGAGPPMAQRIMIGRQANLEGKIARVKDLLGVN